MPVAIAAAGVRRNKLHGEDLAANALGKRLQPLRFRRRGLTSGEYLGEVAERVAEAEEQAAEKSAPRP